MRETFVTGIVRLKLLPTQIVEVPLGAEFLLAREVGEEIKLVYRARQKEQKTEERFIWLGIGAVDEVPPPEAGRFLGTAVMTSSGRLRTPLVYNVFWTYKMGRSW